MYNKILSIINNDQEVEETIVKLETDNLSSSLYYRDEGNMNIVVSLFAHETDEKRVIRFKKISSDDDTNSTLRNYKNELTAFVHFEELLQKYFENSNQFTVVPKIVFLDVDVHALNSFLMRDRPVVRRSKIIGSNYGLLYRDVAFLPKEIFKEKTIRASSAVCIEIKAKQGYLIDDDYESVTKCRYCYFQYLKLKNAKIQHISSYCPVDLFSGKADQMNRAIKGLIENPQNNMKMFLDGKMTFNEHVKEENCLLRIMTSLFPDASCIEKQETLFINLIRKILLKDFKHCDSVTNVAPVHEVTENIHTRSCSSESAILPNNCILNSILTTQRLVKDNFSKMELLDAPEKLENCDMECEKTLLDYKIGSTALDCSIMLTMRRLFGNIENCKNAIDNNHFVSIKTSAGIPQFFAVNATIVDLDLKKDSIAHFRKYKKQYNESKTAYFNFMVNKKIKFQD